MNQFGVVTFYDFCHFFTFPRASAVGAPFGVVMGFTPGFPTLSFGLGVRKAQRIEAEHTRGEGSRHRRRNYSEFGGVAALPRRPRRDRFLRRQGPARAGVGGGRTDCAASPLAAAQYAV